MIELKCPSCGSPNVEQIDVNRFQCPYCGKTFTNFETPIPQRSHFNNNQNVSEEPGCLLNGLSFLFPIVGVVLYFMKKDTDPQSAKSYITYALAGFITGIVLWLI